jgi:hydrogenase-4 component E
VTIIFLHITKKNFAAVFAYGVQSLMVVTILAISFLATGNSPILFVALATLAVKVVLAPIFFVKLIQKHKLTFSSSTYLSTPFTLILIALLTLTAHSEKLASLSLIVPANQVLLSLALSSIFLSVFLIINRKGALSQILGILSFENSIVAFSFFAGLEQSPTLQFGIIFNIFILVIVATVFASMIYHHFGSLDLASLKHLKD